MSKMLQVRNVPEELHAELVRRARKAGRSLTDYVQGILEREIARPPADEVFARIENREPVDLGAPASQLVREEREGRFF